MCSVKKGVFYNLCSRVSLLIKLQAEASKNTFFTEYLKANTSDYSWNSYVFGFSILFIQIIFHTIF